MFINMRPLLIWFPLVGFVIAAQTSTAHIRRDNATLAQLEEEIFEEAATASTCDDCQVCPREARIVILEQR